MYIWESNTKENDIIKYVISITINLKTNIYSFVSINNEYPVQEKSGSGSLNKPVWFWERIFTQSEALAAMLNVGSWCGVQVPVLIGTCVQTVGFRISMVFMKKLNEFYQIRSLGHIGCWIKMSCSNFGSSFSRNMYGISIVRFKTSMVLIENLNGF